MVEQMKPGDLIRSAAYRVHFGYESLEGTGAPTIAVGVKDVALIIATTSISAPTNDTWTYFKGLIMCKGELGWITLMSDSQFLKHWLFEKVSEHEERRT